MTEVASPARSPPRPSDPIPNPLITAQALAKEGKHEAALEEIQSYLAPFRANKEVSVEAVSAAAIAVRLCNELALSSMRDAAEPAQLDAAYGYLKWALKAPHATNALRAVTFNNAGIYYARTGQPQAALRCLERVGKQGAIVVEDDVSVHVKLNMTTVLADLGRHENALEMAQEAVRMLTHAERSGKPVDSSLLSAAYHNLAVQQERLGSRKGHVMSYRAAMLQARKAGQGNGAPMQNFMEQAYTHAKQRAHVPRESPLRSESGLSSSSGMRTGSSLPPVGRAATSGGQPRGSRISCMGGTSSSSHTNYGDPKAKTGASGGRRRGPVGGSAAAGRPHAGEVVSLDDVFSGSVPAAAVPVGAVGGVAPALVAPPGAEGGKRHAPRSAGTARLGASAAE